MCDSPNAILASSENGFTLQPAKHEHYDIIATMSEGIYNGFDYLLPLFHKWIDLEKEKQDKVKNVVLVDPNGKVIGFENFFILENGKSVFAQAMRVDKSLRGKGIGKLFNELCSTYLTRLHPGVSLTLS